MSLKFVPIVSINNIPGLVQIRNGADQATSHYLNQRWLFYQRIYAPRGLNDRLLSNQESKIHTNSPQN